MYFIYLNTQLSVFESTSKKGFVVTVLVRAVPPVQRGAPHGGVLAAAAATGAPAEAVLGRHGEDHPTRAHAAAAAVFLRELLSR